jgi:hypothetical protein
LASKKQIAEKIINLNKYTYGYLERSRERRGKPEGFLTKNCHSPRKLIEGFRMNSKFFKWSEDKFESKAI